MGFAHHLKNAILRPAKVPFYHSWVKQFLLQPRVFDLLSFFMQWKDLSRLKKISQDQYKSDPYFKRVFDHNFGVTKSKKVTTTRRAEPYYQIASLPLRDLSKEKLLIIGPRNIMEPLFAWCYGFSWSNIECIDLYSTNPKIKVMNMEEMSYSDQSFDIVVMSAVFDYSKNPEKCLKEVARILKPGGKLVFESMYLPKDPNWMAGRLKGEEIYSILKKLSFSIYFNVSKSKINRLDLPETCHVFGVIKNDPAVPIYDFLDWSARSQLDERSQALLLQ